MSGAGPTCQLVLLSIVMFPEAAAETRNSQHTRTVHVAASILFSHVVPSPPPYPAPRPDNQYITDPSSMASGRVRDGGVSVTAPMPPPQARSRSLSFRLLKLLVIVLSSGNWVFESVLTWGRHFTPRFSHDLKNCFRKLMKSIFLDLIKTNGRTIITA